MRRLICMLLGGLLISTTAQADKVQDVTISGIVAPDEFVVGLNSKIQFDLLPQVDIDNPVISIGLKLAATELSVAENIERMESYEPDFYLGIIEHEGMIAGEQIVINSDIEVTGHIPAGSYLLTVTVSESGTINADESGGEILEESGANYSYQLSNDFFSVIHPGLPNLIIEENELTGSNGYVLSKSDLPQFIRLNLSIKAQSLPVYSPVNTRFYLDIPGSERNQLVSVEGQEDSAWETDQWLIEADCEGCASIGKDEVVGKALSLKFDPELIASIPTGTKVTLVAVVDPDNSISEWNDNKSDNTAVLPIYIFD